MTLNAAEKAVAFKRLGFDLNAEQTAIASDPSLVRFVAGGERAGKSVLAGAEVAAAAVESTLIWLVGKDFSLARPEFRYAYEALAMAKAVRRVSMPADGAWEMVLKTGSRIVTKSAEDVLKLAAEAPSGIVLCEAAQLDFDTFRRLYGRTAEGRARGDGWLLAVGTFEKGRRWYAEMFRQFKGDNPWGGRSWSLPTWSNTAVFAGGRDDPAIKDIEAGLSPDQFRERFGGEPVAHEDQVFRGESIERCIGPLGQPDGWVTIGLDLGRVRDYSVAIAMNSLRQVVAIERFRKVDWVTQVQRVVDMYHRVKAQRIAVDSTGLGDPIAELLYRNNLIVDPVHLTAQSKAEIIDRLSISLDRGDITIPREEALIAELWDFQATERASGVDRLEASPGKHDDTVIALALAVHAMRGRPVGIAPELPPVEEDAFQRSLRREIARDNARNSGDWAMWEAADGAWNEWDA
jgi:hypothetical protein